MDFHWHKIADAVEEIPFNKNGFANFRIEERSICLVKTPDKFFACAASCPHAGALLGNGFLKGNDTIVCPLHGYKFNLATGVNTSGEGYHLKTFEVKIESDGVYVGF